MRFLISAFATAAMFFSAITATAVEFSIVGPTSALVMPGEEFTIDIRMTNSAGISVVGLGASITNYGANQFVSGLAVGTYLNSFCAAPGICLGGLLNFAGQPVPSDAIFPQRELAESSNGANGNRIWFAQSTSTIPATGIDIDQGLDDMTGTAQFSVTFLAIEDALINVGTDSDYGVVLPDGTIIQAPGATFQLNVIPEPGTALLLGLGLAGLARSGRRGHRP